MAKIREGFRLIPHPPEAGKILDARIYKGIFVLACENGVWTMDPVTEEFIEVKPVDPTAPA